MRAERAFFIQLMGTCRLEVAVKEDHCQLFDKRDKMTAFLLAFGNSLKYNHTPLSFRKCLAVFNLDRGARNTDNVLCYIFWDSKAIEYSNYVGLAGR